VYANMGHGTLGLTLAAGSAELLADTLAGRPSSLPMVPFSFKSA
jgi:D-amino-acid dehydrogenase